MLLANNGIIPPKQWLHDPKLCDIDGNTVAINLLKNKIDVPEEWRYDSTYKFDYDNSTTAMKLAYNKIIPPKYFEHDPKLHDK